MNGLSAILRKSLPVLLAACLLAQTLVVDAAQIAEPVLQEPPVSGPSNTTSGGGRTLTGAVYQSSYVLGPGDAIYLEDAAMGELAKDGKLLSDGSIHLPLVGKVFLAGLTVKEAKQRLVEKYGQYYVDPKLTLQITGQHPVRVYVMGAVGQPGVYVSGKDMSAESLSRVQLGHYDTMYWYYRMYLADALMQAGGLNYNADVKDIRIRRTFPQPVTIHVNLLDLFVNGSIIQDIPLQDQDVVEIGELPDSAIVMDAQWEEFARQNVNNGVFKISVMGAVISPGPYEVKTHDTVLTAIAKAGGFTDVADHNKVFVLRSTSSGQVIKRELNMTDKALIGGKPFETWAALLPNDVVFVDESESRKAVGYAMSIGQRAQSAALYPFFFRLFTNKIRKVE